MAPYIAGGNSILMGDRKGAIMPPSSPEECERAYTECRAGLQLLLRETLREAYERFDSEPEFNFLGVTRDSAAVGEFRHSAMVYGQAEIENFAAILAVRGTSGAQARDALREHLRKITELLPEEIGVLLERLKIDPDHARTCWPSNGEMMADLLSPFETFFWEIESLDIDDVRWPGICEIGKSPETCDAFDNIGAPWYSFMRLTREPWSASTTASKDVASSRSVDAPGAAAYLENFRRSRGLSQIDLCSKAHISERAYRDFKNTGKCSPATLAELANAVDMDYAALLAANDSTLVP
jgi:hypothetical protein